MSDAYMIHNGQETLHGFYIGDSVGYVGRNAGHVCEIIDIVDHDFKKGKTLVELQLPNGATVVEWDSKLSKIPQNHK